MHAFEPGSRPNDLRRLLENGTWVRRLAVRLLYDESLADDVVQEVWITAIQRPPSRPEALRGWLSAVARSLCLRANRTFLRRKRLEQRRMEEPPAPSVQEIEERLESRRRLLDAVLSLDEPYRSVVYLHFFEELRLIEIARLRATPDSTVRTQLARGIEKLRERFERDAGGRGKAQAMLLALVLPAELLHLSGAASAAEAPAVELAPAPGATTYLARSGILVPAFAVLSVTALVFFGTAPSRGTRTGETAGAAALAGVGSSNVEPPPSSAEAHPKAMPEAAAARMSAPPAATAAVRVRVVSAAGGHPVPAAKVYRAPRTDPRSELIGETGVDGTLLVRDAAAVRDPWIVLAEGFVEHREPSVRRDAAGDHLVELEPEFPARIVVLNADGSPASGVPITVLALVRGVGPVEPVIAVTDFQGEVVYAYRRLDTTIRIAAPDHVSLSLPAETPSMTMLLRPGRPVEAIVLGPGGAPVPGCRVRFESASLRSAVTAATDGEGRLSLGVLDPAEEVTLRLFVPGSIAYRFTGLPPGSGPWRLRLPDGVAVSGVVFGPGGEPITGGHAFILVPEGAGDEGPEGPASQVRPAGLPSGEPVRGAGSARRLVTRARTAIDASGRFTLGPVAAGEAEAYLFIHHPAHERHLERLEVVAGHAPVTVRLARGTQITGILALPDGAPLAGALLHFGETWSNGIESVIGRTRTAADGSFAFQGLPAGVGQHLAGAWTEDGDAVVRTGVFVAAFAPDVLLEREMEDGSVAVEIAPGAFDISDALVDGSTIRLAGAARERLASIEVRLRGEDGFPVRAWTRAVGLDGAGGFFTGLLGQNLRRPRLFSDQTLAVERLRRVDLALLPDGHQWQMLSGLDLREDLLAGVVLAPLARHPCRLRVRHPDGAPAAGWPVLIGLPFGTPPRVAVLIGRTDVEGTLALGMLPSMRHALAIPFASGELGGDVLGEDELEGRGTWTWVHVEERAECEVTAPQG